ncbi:MAG: hypothetical protein WCP58_11135, partial [bacterium]
MHKRFWRLTVVLLLGALAFAASGGFFLAVPAQGLAGSTTDSLPFTLEERSGVDRLGECASFGLPLPRAWNATSADQLRVRGPDGELVPAQLEPLSRWGAAPNNVAAPIQWLLISLVDSLTPSSQHSLALEKSGPGPLPATPLVITTPSPSSLQVDTGAAQFLLDGQSFNLLAQVTIGGQTLLEPLSPTQAIRYAPAGTDSIVPGGSPRLTPRPASLEIERSGPILAVVKAEGSILDASERPVLDYTARLHFTAGSGEVRLDFTVENNHPILVQPWDGQPANAHDLGAANSVYLGSLQLALRLKSAAGPLRILSENEVVVDAPTVPIRLDQDSSGTVFWDAYLGEVGWPGQEASAAPRLQSYCQFPGYALTGSATLAEGSQALGWMAMARSGGPSLMMAVRGFWQNFPKALVAFPDGALAADLFPHGERFRHNLRVGEEKTHTL